MLEEQDNAHAVPAEILQWLKDEYSLRDVDNPEPVLRWLLADPMRFFLWQVSREVGMLHFEVDRLRKQLVALSTHLGGYEADR